jgi:hypothetical protein
MPPPKSKRPSITAKKAITKQLSKKSANSPKTGKSSGTTTISLSNTHESKLAEFNQRQNHIEATIRAWGRRLTATKKTMAKTNDLYRQILYKVLQEAYAVYSEVKSSDLADDFFAEIRYELKKNGIKIQSNTTDAALIIRYICGAEITTKTLHDYSRVLIGAENFKIKPDTLADWLTEKTMTKVIADQRCIENSEDSYKDKLDRARRVVLRMLEIKQRKPVLSGRTTAWEAEKMIGSDGIWIGIGTATRRMDQENFYADINLNMFLPPNIDIEFFIINILAKQIASDVEIYEEKIKKLEESVWGKELWEKLTSAGFEESHRVSEWWSNRQQAAKYDDQKQFYEEVVKPKKVRKKLPS